jgi:hypothetical protein
VKNQFPKAAKICNLARKYATLNKAQRGTLQIVWKYPYGKKRVTLLPHLKCSAIQLTGSFNIIKCPNGYFCMMSIFFSKIFSVTVN